MNYDGDLKTINDSLAAALAHRAELAQALAEIEAAGMYPSEPSEQWQDRGGSGQYLYMLFRLAPDGQTYQGPDGKRKVYVGADPARIAEARRLAANRGRWGQARQAARALDQWIELRQSELHSLAARCDRWPTADLGPLTPAPAGTTSPKSEG